MKHRTEFSYIRSLEHDWRSDPTESTPIWTLFSLLISAWRTFFVLLIGQGLKVNLYIRLYVLLKQDWAHEFVETHSWLTYTAIQTRQFTSSTP